MDESDAHRAFARSGCNALDRTLSNVADREDTRQRRLEHERRASARKIDMAVAMSTRRDVAPGVTLN